MIMGPHLVMMMGFCAMPLIVSPAAGAATTNERIASSSELPVLASRCHMIAVERRNAVTGLQSGTGADFRHHSG